MSKSGKSETLSFVAYGQLNRHMQADRYVMHELYHLERTSREAYQEFRFSQGVKTSRVLRYVFTNCIG